MVVKTIIINKRYDLDYFESTGRIRLWDNKTNAFVGKSIELRKVYPRLKKVI